MSKTKECLISVAEWERLVDKGHHPSVMTVLSGSSMHPLIRYRCDYIRIVPIERQLKKGDIVLFKSDDGRYVVHRITALKKGSVQTLGDWCFYHDAWMKEAQVIGLVSDIYRGHRTIHADSVRWRMMGRIWSRALPVRNTIRRIFRFTCKVLPV